MNITAMLIKRNVKLFFKDKGMFLTSLITPVILLVLYSTFLGNVYRDSFVANLPDSVVLSDKLIDGLVAGQLVSSILAVSCVTVSFSSNFLMVQDRANGSIKDIMISPVRPSSLAISYYAATLISSLIICLSAVVLSLAYVALVGWYLSPTDVLLLLLDVVILVLFGTAVSSVINFFLSTSGQISAVGTVISSGYGFVCGAYMPISSFSEGLQRVISFLPGTYGTSLVRNHAMQGALEEMKEVGIPEEVILNIKDALDCNLYFFGVKTPVWLMYVILISFIAVSVIAYVILNLKNKKDT